MPNQNHSAKQKRQARHIAASYKKRGVSDKRAKSIAWATVNSEAVEQTEAWAFNGAGAPVFMGNPGNVSQFDSRGQTSPGASYIPDEVAKMIIKETGLRKLDTISKRVIEDYLKSIGLSAGLVTEVAMVLRDVYGLTPTFEESVEGSSAALIAELSESIGESYPMPFAVEVEPEEEPEMLSEVEFIGSFIQQQFMESDNDGYDVTLGLLATLSPEDLFAITDFYEWVGPEAFDYIEQVAVYGEDGAAEKLVEGLCWPRRVKFMPEHVQDLFEDLRDNVKLRHGGSMAKPVVDFRKRAKQMAKADSSIQRSDPLAAKARAAELDPQSHAAHADPNYGLKLTALRDRKRASGALAKQQKAAGKSGVSKSTAVQKSSSGAMKGAGRKAIDFMKRAAGHVGRVISGAAKHGANAAVSVAKQAASGAATTAKHGADAAKFAAKHGASAAKFAARHGANAAVHVAKAATSDKAKEVYKAAGRTGLAAAGLAGRAAIGVAGHTIDAAGKLGGKVVAAGFHAVTGNKFRKKEEPKVGILGHIGHAIGALAAHVKQGYRKTIDAAKDATPGIQHISGKSASSHEAEPAKAEPSSAHVAAQRVAMNKSRSALSASAKRSMLKSRRNFKAATPGIQHVASQPAAEPAKAAPPEVKAPEAPAAPPAAKPSAVPAKPAPVARKVTKEPSEKVPAPKKAPRVVAAPAAESILNSGNLLSEMDEILGYGADDSVRSPAEVVESFNATTIVDIAILESLSEMDWPQVAEISGFMMMKPENFLSLVQSFKEDRDTFRAEWFHLEEHGEKPTWLKLNSFMALAKLTLDESVVPRLVYWATLALAEADEGVSLYVAEAYPELGKTVYGPAGNPKEGPEIAKKYMTPRLAGTDKPTGDDETRMFANADDIAKGRKKKLADVMAALDGMRKQADAAGVPPEGMFLDLYRDMHREKVRYS